jgi:hypothetical protein
MATLKLGRPSDFGQVMRGRLFRPFTQWPGDSFSRQFLLPILTVTNEPGRLGVDVDKQNKPQQTSEEEVTPEAPVAPLQARSPYRPLSRRKRQEQIVEPPPAVERPSISQRFDASPTRISAALAKAGAPEQEPVLVWSAGDVEIEVEVEEPETEG